jgi:hypothetical protein
MIRTTPQRAPQDRVRTMPPDASARQPTAIKTVYSRGHFAVQATANAPVAWASAKQAWQRSFDLENGRSYMP